MLNILLSIFGFAAAGFFSAWVVSAILDTSNELYILSHTGGSCHIHICSNFTFTLFRYQPNKKARLQGVNCYADVLLCSNDLSIAVIWNVIMLADTEVRQVV